MTYTQVEPDGPTTLLDEDRDANLLKKAVTLQLAGDFQTAASAYEEILAGQPNNVSALGNLGSLWAAQGNEKEAETLYRRVLELRPNDADTLNNLANLMMSRGDFDGAEAAYRAALRSNPTLPAVLGNFSELLVRQNNVKGALEYCAKALAADPTMLVAQVRMASLLLADDQVDEARKLVDAVLDSHPENASALCILGDILADADDVGPAEEAYQRAAVSQPDWAEPLQKFAALKAETSDPEASVRVAPAALEREPGNASVLRDLGNTSLNMGDLEKAQIFFEKSWAIDPLDWPTGLHLGNLHYGAGRPAEALQYFEHADRLNPKSYEILLCMAMCHQQLKHQNRAEADLQKLIHDFPGRAEAHKALGNAHYIRNLYEASVVEYEKARAIDADDVETVVLLAVSHMEAGNNAVAIELIDQGLEELPEWAFAHLVKGQALSHLGRMAEAIESGQKAYDLAEPGDVGTAMNVAGVFERSNKRKEALEIYRMVLRLDPDHGFALTRSVDLLLTLCEWDNYDEFVKGVLASTELAVENNRPLNVCVQDLQNFPITWPALVSAAKRSADMAEDQVRVDRKKANFTFDQRLNSWRSGNQRKLRVGWALPYTFRSSFPMLLKSVIERMDRQHFEVVGYSMQPGDSDFDRQYRAMFDSFRDLPEASPEIGAKMIYDDEIDVLIDVSGHTSINCQPVMAMRPAPVQAHMLGYGITTGSDYIKYLVTDPVWMQPRYREHCTETMVYMPDSWFVGYRPEVSEKAFTRAELDLPDDAFVFCSFNQPFKFEPSIFDIWMRMLKRVEGSVLWLGAWDESTRANLTKEALARDVDADRIIFGIIVSHGDHMARLRHADLLLDTRFHGGGATTIDALWAGVPILSFRGDLPTSGNGTTMAHAIGAPEMAVDSMEAYEETGVALGLDRARHAALRAKVEANRLTHPLFNRDRYTRHLERGIGQMWEQTVAGGEGDLTVKPLASTTHDG